MITGAQIKAARALLGFDQQQLAALAELSVPTIRRMEASEGSVRAVVGSLEKVLKALADAGVEFISAGASSHGLGPGVRLIDPLQARRVGPGRVIGSREYELRTPLS